MAHYLWRLGELLRGYKLEHYGIDSIDYANSGGLFLLAKEQGEKVTEDDPPNLSNQIISFFY